MVNKLTRFGYIVEKAATDKKTLDKIKADLTVTPYRQGSYGKNVESFSLFKENDTHMSIPKFYAMNSLGKPDINRLDENKYPKFDVKYEGTLRPVQEIIVAKVFDGFQKVGGGLLVTGCGSGKTNMAIYIACKYQLKTLYVVHNTYLMEQMRDRILSTTNIKSVGVIQGKKTDVDHPFVIGMIQSLVSKKYDEDIFKDFGMIIIDEVHHMAARNFSRFLADRTTVYTLGITAEKERNDRLYCILNWYLGPILHYEDQKPNDMVVVKRFNYKTSNTKRGQLVLNRYTKEPDNATMVTNLIKIKKRNRFILNLILDMFDQGKNILFLSDRLKQVTLLQRLLEANRYTKGNVGIFVGGMKKSELAKSALKQIILGIYPMAQEGLDIPDLNVLILSTPKSTIKQPVGRILRKEIYTEHPIVIDIVDIDNSVFKGQSKKRERYYRSQKFNIQDFYVADYEGEENYNMWDDPVFIRQSLIKPVVKVEDKAKAKTNKKPYERHNFDFANINFID